MEVRTVSTWKVEYTEVWDNLDEASCEVVVLADSDQFLDVVEVGQIVRDAVVNGTRHLYADDADDDAKPIGETFVKQVRIDAVREEQRNCDMIVYEGDEPATPA